MKPTLPILLILLSFSATARADDGTFANFGGTDYFPASSGTVTLTNSNSALNAAGNSFTGSTGLNTGSSSLNTGGGGTSVPQAGFNGAGGPTLNTGGLSSGVPH